jgi:hypothetical protein
VTEAERPELVEKAASQDKNSIATAAVKAAFGKQNRDRLLSSYFAERGNPTSADAWIHVYRLLLWIDRTTGLAHCYESDKSQPGRHWYDRSLAFHAWLAQTIGLSPGEVAGEIDWLFKRAVEDFAIEVGKAKSRLAKVAERQRKPYLLLGMPEPGEDAELVTIVEDMLGSYLRTPPSETVWRDLTGRLRGYLTQENKRKNLVGEGFEDTLAALIARMPNESGLVPRTRVPIEDVPGFNAPRKNEKPKKVDLYIFCDQWPHRTLVSAKWSIRADREEQFASDFESYARLETAGEPFDYSLLTNEFDPARLVAACERSVSGRQLFTHVVHINTDALRSAYGPSPRRSAAEAVRLIDSGRLTSLGPWLTRLASAT